MKTRKADVWYIQMGGNIKKIHFDLECHPDTRFTKGATFEIVSPGMTPVRGTLLEVVERSNGTASIRIIGDHSDSMEYTLARLRRMPSVSNIRVNEK